MVVSQGRTVHVYEFNPDGTWDETVLDGGGAVALHGDQLLVDKRWGDGPVLYRLSERGDWTREAIFKDPGGGIEFGWAVAISGDNILIGAPRGDSPHAQDTGSAYLYQPDGSGGWTETKFTPSDGGESDWFGGAVAIHGNRVLIGALNHGEDGLMAGAAYLYEPDGSGGWTETKFTPSNAKAENGFGVDVSIDEAQLLIGSFGAAGYKGRAYLYRPDDGSGWKETMLIPASRSGDAMFGYSVDSERDALIVGAPLDDSNESEAGSATLFGQLSWLKVSGSTSIRQGPTCASFENCPSTLLGYTDSVFRTPEGVWRFNLHLGDMNVHNERTCAVPPPNLPPPGDEIAEISNPCNPWIAFDAEISDRVGSTVEEGTQVTLGHLRWLDGDHAWVPEDGFPINGTIHRDGSLDIDVDTLPRRAITESGETLNLRFDTAENPWEIGDAAWDLSLTAAQVQLIAPPVIIVHGWTEDNEKAAYGQSYPDWENELENVLRGRGLDWYGQDPWAWGGADDPTTAEDDDAIRKFAYHNKRSFRDTARFVLRPHVQDLRSDVGFNGDVSLLSMSFGGLVSRWYVEDPRDELDQVAPVGKAVTMGTPHMGSKLADIHLHLQDTPQGSGSEEQDRFYIGNDGRNVGRYQVECYPTRHGGRTCVEEFAEWRDWWDSRIEANRFDASSPGGFDEPMLADFELKEQEGSNNPILNELNDDPTVEGVSYYLLAGRAFQNLGSDWGVLIPGIGDGVVSIDSATLGRSPAHCSNVLNVPKTKPWETHTGLPLDPGIQDAVFAFLSDAHPRLCSTEDPPPFTAPRSFFDLWWYFPPIFSGHTASEDSAPTPVGTEASDGTGFGAQSWNVTAASNALFWLTAPNGTLADLELRLVAPDGSWASPTNGTLTGVSWNISSGDGFVDQATAEIGNPMDGSWTLEAYGTLSKPVALRGTVYLDSIIHIDDRTAPNATVGEQTTVQIAFRNGSEALPGATVQAWVSEPVLNHTEELELRDDGAAPDRSAGDGVYTASYTPLSPGQHPYRVQATYQDVIREHDGTISTTQSFTIPKEACADWVDPQLVEMLHTDSGLAEAYIQCVRGGAVKLIDAS